MGLIYAGVTFCLYQWPLSVRTFVFTRKLNITGILYFVSVLSLVFIKKNMRVVHRRWPASLTKSALCLCTKEMVVYLLFSTSLGKLCHEFNLSNSPILFERAVGGDGQ